MGLDQVDLEALRRYARSPEGRGLVLILEKKLRDSDLKLRELLGEHLVRQQGRSLQLQELIDDLTKADQVLERQALTRRQPKVRPWTQP